MMKPTLIAAALSVGVLSLNTAYATPTHKHAASHSASMDMHEEHASAMGKPGNPAKVTRTMTVDMNDNMRFSPEKISVKKGETIKFIVKNSGRIKHEMVLGSAQEIKEHAEMMKKMPGMEHADANMVVVDPGKTGEIVWQFNKAGQFDFACLQPGHFEAGMRGKIAVK